MTFQKRLKSGEFVVLAEMNTPKGVDISDFVSNARSVKGRVDAVVVPDMDNGVMRMSALAGGALLRQQGLEPIIHVYGRDRNRMALQGDLLAAHVLGISNLIVVAGEPMHNGDHLDAVAVNDLDELDLIAAIRRLQNGKDCAGFDLAGKPRFTVGCALGVFSDPGELDAELEKAGRMVAAGAQFVVTPPVFDRERLAVLVEKAAGLRVPVVATVFLLKSVGVARYMSLKMPGIYIPETIISRLRTAQDRELECLRIAGETVAAFKGLVQGVKIETLGWEHRLPEILDFAGV